MEVKARGKLSKKAKKSENLEVDKVQKTAKVYYEAFSKDLDAKNRDLGKRVSY